jgi:hypothetical protein
VKGFFERCGNLAAVAVFALVVIGGGIAYATIPTEGGEIHGCYTKARGVLRVIDYPNQRCNTRFEVPIQWNQAGLQGPQGEPGPQGASGPVSGYEIVQGSSDFGPGLTKNATAFCPVGKEPISGGSAVSSVADGLGYDNAMNAAIVWSRPMRLDAFTTGWDVLAQVGGTWNESWRVVAFAVCAPVQEG